MAIEELNAELYRWVQQRVDANPGEGLRGGLVSYINRLEALESGADGSGNGDQSYQLQGYLQSQRLHPFLLSPLQHTKIVHFIRHGHGYHNYPLNSFEMDPHLTEVGWRQTEEVRSHILQLDPPLDVEVVITSPLTRTLETAAGIFGCDEPADRREVIMAEQTKNVKGVCQSHGAIYNNRGLQFIAIGLCREQMGGNPCDQHRSRSELMLQFPGIDMSNLEGETDTYFNDVMMETDDVCKLRVNQFFQWLMTRPERSIAVVTHCNFLLVATDEACSHLRGGSLSDADFKFHNCEMRSYVLSACQPPSPQLGAWFRPKTQPVKGVIV
eukprot:evm.model.scf_1905.2 EVM.evm.TU.scf_1905.2   scf_1905:10207-15073(-)